MSRQQCPAAGDPGRTVSGEQVPGPLHDPCGSWVSSLINRNVNRRRVFPNSFLLPTLRKFLRGGGKGKRRGGGVGRVKNRLPSGARWEKSCHLNPDKTICSSYNQEARKRFMAFPFLPYESRSVPPQSTADTSRRTHSGKCGLLCFSPLFEQEHKDTTALNRSIGKPTNESSLFHLKLTSCDDR